MSKNIILFLTVIFLGLASYYFIHLGHYPIALVNGKFITAKAFNDEYAAALQYYQRTMAQQKTPVDLRSPAVQKELRRAALSDLIEKALINAELKRREGGDYAEVVENKLRSVTANTKNLAEAAKLLYGLEFGAFRVMVLVPEAEKELLEGRLFLEQKKLTDWLAQAVTSASVTVLTPEFAWGEGKLTASK